MKQELVVYTDMINSNFFHQIFYENNISIKSLTDFEKEENQINCGLVFIKDNQNLIKKVLSKKFKNKIFLIDSKNYQIQRSSENIIFQTINIKLLKNKITNLLLSQDYNYKNLSMIDNNLTNTKSKISIKVTEVEKQILVNLFEINIIKRQEVKEKILNIKQNIETNSLDSHLTRIRKKLKKIKNKINIISRDDTLSIQ